ncbi:hypothetical protein E4Z66_11660 [Aliishimia ponticola]|uniref:Chemotaxis protein CheA n=2 Tax=Aliishimia ponticola TaxID=2499833 RepID=A0A4S4NCF2_9RHOB|nr:hypothetical protein E4Z66_11660 [Aliishimia ponticola]
MSNNKILTVSYGTFSCTLEGFEDSFDTMKAIAEYFRDLASEDRYFGAEPPQPDAEMLARIAEREIARRVEAHTNDSGIHLRAGASAPALGVAAVAAASVAAEAAPEVAAEEVAPEAAPVEAAPVAEDQAVQDAVAEAVQEDVAEEATEADTAEIAADAQEPVEDVIEDAAPLAAEDDSAIEEVADTDDVQDAAETEETIEPQEAAEVEEIAEVEDAAEVEEVAEVEDITDAVAAPEVIETKEPEVAKAAPTTNFGFSTSQSSVMHASLRYAMNTVRSSSSAPAVPALDDNAAKPTTDAAEIEDLVAEPVAQDVQAEPDSIAAKLQRIRDVVAKNQAAQDGYSEDEHAVDTADEDYEDAASTTDDADDLDAAFDMGSVLEGLEDAASDEDDTLEDEMYEEDAEDDADDMSDIVGSIAESLAAAHEESMSGQPAAQVEDDDIADVLSRLDEQLAEDEAAASSADEYLAEEMAEELAAHTAEQEPVLLDPSLMVGADEDDSFDEVALAEETGDIDADLMEVVAQAEQDFEDIDLDETAPRARLLKVKRDEVDAALEAGLLEEVADEGIETSLSEEDEADLMRDLAALESELGGQDAELSADTDIDLDLDLDLDGDVADELAIDADDEIEAAMESAASHLFDDVDGDEEGKLDRLMAEADQHMHEPEANSRREAFSHMRAAVAATKADDKLGDDAHTDETDYRTDLAAAVKPRRPVASANAERPRDSRPAPLKLVAAQRIDGPDAATAAGPVRPRRVSTADLTAPMEDAGSFADYANTQGATELPEILEAAASYLSFVEGREQFSRPQLMTKVRQLQLDGFTREDGLRHFGKLLRSGKIEKLKAGRFTVSEGIGFRPDDERQAG